MQKEVNKSEGGSLAANVVRADVLDFFSAQLMYSPIKFPLINCNETDNQDTLFVPPSPAACTMLYNRGLVSAVFDGGCGCSAIEEIIRDHFLLS